VNTSRSGRSTALERALDKALAIPAARIEERVARMRRDRPGADAAELVEMAASRFRRDAGLSSGAVGASAAIPAISTGAAAARRKSVEVGCRVVVGGVRCPVGRSRVVVSQCSNGDGQRGVRGAVRSLRSCHASGGGDGDCGKSGSENTLHTPTGARRHYSAPLHSSCAHHQPARSGQRYENECSKPYRDQRRVGGTLLS